MDFTKKNMDQGIKIILQWVARHRAWIMYEILLWIQWTDEQQTQWHETLSIFFCFWSEIKFTDENTILLYWRHGTGTGTVLGIVPFFQLQIIFSISIFFLKKRSRIIYHNVNFGRNKKIDVFPQTPHDRMYSCPLEFLSSIRIF